MTSRVDGRKIDELRKMSARIGVVKRADGSAMFQIGDTIAFAAVYGPRELHPRFLQNPEKAMLRCHYDMASFSVSERKKPGPSRRSVEISLVTEKALSSVVDLKLYPNAVIDVFIQIIQANAGTRCAGITAAAMALAHAGVPMREMVAAVSVGKVGKEIVLDLTKEEEDEETGATDIPVAMTSYNKGITLLQLDGEVNKKELIEALKLAGKGCEEIFKLQERVLKEVYSGGKNE
ncbi:MAG TPA: exosome complex exonuclease Rrp41 [Candidatus Nanoarchaeia archaeon]|nr:exosome complex exonuclease Rrp41 [Candidatus Nanoarchaeia archaeon]